MLKATMHTKNQFLGPRSGLLYVQRTVYLRRMQHFVNLTTPCVYVLSDLLQIPLSGTYVRPGIVLVRDMK